MLQQQGRLADAIVAHRQAIKLNPNYAEAYLALGNALRQQGNLEEAMAVLSVRDHGARRDYAEAHNNIGVLLQMQGRLDQAAVGVSRGGGAEAGLRGGPVQSRRRAASEARVGCRRSGVSAASFRLDPGIAVVHNNLGAVLKDQGLLDEALAAFDDAVNLKPDYRRGVLQPRHGPAAAGRGWKKRWRLTVRPSRSARITPTRSTMPASCFRNSDAPARRSIFTAGCLSGCRLTPMPATIWERRCWRQGGPTEARAAFEQALTHKPDFPEAFYNLGNARRELGDLAEAIAAYRNALRLRPDYADAFSQLVYHRAQACDWDNYQADQERLVDMVRRGVRVPPFYLLSTPASAIGSIALCAAVDRADQAAAAGRLRA